MKEKVLLINAPSDKRYFLSALPPLGILSIASVLRGRGVEVAIGDLNTAGNWRRELYSLMRECVPSMVGISSVISNQGAAVEIAALVKGIDRAITVVAGGPHPTLEPRAHWNEHTDFIIPYEGERLMLDFVLSGCRASMPGVIPVKVDHGGDIPCFREPVWVEDPDQLPLPAFDLVDVRRYHGSLYRKRPMVSLVTSRGCPHACVFCSQTVFGRKWRGQSAEHVVEQMFLLQRSGIGEISFEDDNFTFDMERIFRICALIRSRGIRICWQANGIRADRLSRDLLKEMRDAGCWKISIGPEVGDEESLARLKKGMTLDHFRRAARWCKSLGIAHVCYFIIGFPFQDREGMRKIVDFAIELDPLIMDMNKILPLSGTEVYGSFPEAFRCRNRVSFNEPTGDRALENMFLKAHAAFYLRPGKIAEIAAAVGLRRFLELGKHAFRILAP